MKLGFSLSDYYEANGEDNGFGYFDIGALFTVPFSSAPTKFGSWNLHGGVNYLALGDGTKSFNVKDGTAGRQPGDRVDRDRPVLLARGVGAAND